MRERGINRQKENINITIDKEVLSKIDEMRGGMRGIKRSFIINLFLRQLLFGENDVKIIKKSLRIFDNLPK